MLDECHVPGCSRPTYSLAPTCHRHTQPTDRTIRTIVAVLDDHPTMAEIRRRTGYSMNTIQRAFYALYDRGIVSRRPHSRRYQIIGVLP